MIKLDFYILLIQPNQSLVSEGQSRASSHIAEIQSHVAQKKKKSPENPDST